MYCSRGSRYDDDFDTESEDDIDERVAIIKAGGSSEDYSEALANRLGLRIGIGRPSSRSGGRVSLSIERPTQVGEGGLGLGSGSLGIEGTSI